MLSLVFERSFATGCPNFAWVVADSYRDVLWFALKKC